MDPHLHLSHHLLFISLSQGFDLTLTDHVTEVCNTHTHTHTREVHKISDRTVSSVSCAQTLTDEVDAVFGPSKLLDEMLHILLQKAETGYPGCHGSIGWWSDMGQYEYLGGSEKADGLQVFHVVSVLRVDSLKQVDFLLQDF